MAKKKNSSGNPKALAAYESDKYQEQMKAYDEYFSKALNSLEVASPDDKVRPLNNKFSKEEYRKLIKDMAKNAPKLREMSNFLARVSMPYSRLLSHFTNIPLFYWNLTPQLEYNTQINKDKILKQYYNVLKKVKNINIAYEMRKVLATVLREGVFYGYIYEDKNSFFIHKLNPDYCKIRSMSGGCYNFQFDFSFFNKYPEYLQWVDSSFAEMYSLYQKDKKAYRFQILDETRTICIKYSPDQIDEVLPPFLGLFEALLDVIDARTIQRNKDTIDNYKLIALKLPFLEHSKTLDDFKLHIDTATKFYNQVAEATPPAVGVAVTPMDIETVDFNNNHDDRADVLSTCTRSVFDESGVSQSLFNSKEMNAKGLESSIKTDVSFVWNIIESIETWIRRYIYFNSSGKTKYSFEILRADIFNVRDYQTQELALANSGVPNKMRLAAAAGLDPFTVVSNQLFENDILDITNSWQPLKTSYTMSGKFEEKAEQTKEDEQTAQQNEQANEQEENNAQPINDEAEVQDESEE